MNGEGARDFEDGSDDMLAAEYVLGVLDAARRRDAARRIETDQTFARLVDAWEVRLSGLAEAYVPEPAPERVKQAIDRRIFRTGGAAGAGLWSSLAFWRGLAGAAVAAMLLLAAVPYLTGPQVAPQPARLAASLAADGSEVRYLALYDAAAGQVAMSHVHGARGPGRDFELWLIEGDRPPASMGVIPEGGSVHMPVDDAMRARIASGAVFAISSEPQGGSPTGRPTGPVVAAGSLLAI